MAEKIDQKEAERLIRAIDIMADRLSDKEVKFIADMIDNPPATLSPGQRNWIAIIAEKHNIL